MRAGSPALVAQLTQAHSEIEPRLHRAVVFTEIQGLTDLRGGPGAVTE